jgi:lipid A 4'-phosphatase
LHVDVDAVREAAGHMHYFNLLRGRIIVGAFLAVSVVLILVPHIDLAISRFFYDGHGFLRYREFQKLQQTLLTVFLFTSIAAVLALYGYNRTHRRNLAGIDGRRVLFLLLVLGIGPGLIVNTTLKDNFGRARPRDVVEFGGARQFTPAFVMSRECNRNCSFSSGDAAGGFFALSLALALSRRRAVFVAALAFGAAVSLSRIASGAHFFSDTVTSFFIVLLVSDLLYHYIVLSAVERRGLMPAVAMRPPA